MYLGMGVLFIDIACRSLPILVFAHPAKLSNGHR